MINVITVIFTVILNIYKYLGRFSVLIITKLPNPETVNPKL